MLQVSVAVDRKVAIPCPGLVDDAGAIRAACRVCGKCDDLIRDMMRDIAAAPAIAGKQKAPATAPA